MVKEWDNVVRSILPANGLWFSSAYPDTGKIDPNITQAGQHRRVRARKDLENWLKKVGLPYHSPHKFRHGHAVYALKKANDVATLKAISQNLMHANLSVTDGVYGILSDTDTKEIISSFGKTNSSRDEDFSRPVSLIRQLEEYLKDKERSS